MFERYADYMYSLLFSPLKKVQKASNQFYLFFKVIGSLYDQTIKDIQRIREESMIVTASEVILTEHGRDRNMPRLHKETLEDYRTRLAMKGILAEQAGTKASIELCLKAFSATGEVIPYYTLDPERWAEFLVQIYLDMDHVYIPVESMREQVREVKPASAKDNYRLTMQTEGILSVGYRILLHMMIKGYSWKNQNPLLLNGLWLLDGSRTINGYTDSGEMQDYRVKIHVSAKGAAILSGSYRMDCLNWLDGSWLLDGSRALNGGRYDENKTNQNGGRMNVKADND